MTDFLSTEKTAENLKSTFHDEKHCPIHNGPGYGTPAKAVSTAEAEARRHAVCVPRTLSAQRSVEQPEER